MNLSDLPQDLLGIAIVALLLGMKHGFDADHLATIDGLARFNARANPTLSRLAGALFSLGHGAVVLMVSLLAATVATNWRIPQWLEAFGAWLSIAFLLALGLTNLAAVVRAQPHEVVQVRGLRSALLGSRVVRRARALGIALVGALFALSFDTVSQAALLALAGTRFGGGWQAAMLLALVFTAGMLIVDGVNGLWIARLIRSSDAAARVASRVMGMVVGSVSLLVAAVGIGRHLWPVVEQWTDGKEMAFGAAVLGLVAAGFLVGQWAARQRGAVQAR
jgi:high-affinity nickel-transport protein